MMTPKELYEAACNIAEKYGYTPRNSKDWPELRASIIYGREYCWASIHMTTNAGAIETDSNSRPPEDALKMFELEIKIHQYKLKKIG